MASSLRAFTFSLGTIRRFPEVLYLAPEPAAPFVALTERLFSLFPEFPPYGGQHAAITPHLTVARASDAELRRVETELRASLGTAAVQATCSEFVLIENSSGLWGPMHAFQLPPSAAHADR